MKISKQSFCSILRSCIRIKKTITKMMVIPNSINNHYIKILHSITKLVIFMLNCLCQLRALSTVVILSFSLHRQLQKCIFITEVITRPIWSYLFTLYLKVFFGGEITIIITVITNAVILIIIIMTLTITTVIKLKFNEWGK